MILTLPCTGRNLSQLDDLLFLLDDSLDRFVADALRKVGYNFTSVFEEWAGAAGIKDPEIIAWCGDRNAVWVHKDDSAKKDHQKLIISNQIRTLWIYRKNGILSGKDQLRTLAFTLQDQIDDFNQYPNRRHYKLTVHGANPHPKISRKTYGI